MPDVLLIGALEQVAGGRERSIDVARSTVRGRFWRSKTAIWVRDWRRRASLLR